MNDVVMLIVTILLAVLIDILTFIVPCFFIRKVVGHKIGNLYVDWFLLLIVGIIIHVFAGMKGNLGVLDAGIGWVGAYYLAGDEPIGIVDKEQGEKVNNSQKDETQIIDQNVSLTKESGVNTVPIYCRKCGAKLIENSAFCSNCGERIKK